MKLLSFQHIGNGLLIFLLTACAADSTPNTSHVVLPIAVEQNTSAVPMSETEILNQYNAYQLALDDIKADGDFSAGQFLSQYPNGTLSEDVRSKWLMQLAKREEWNAFINEYQRLPETAQNQNLRCYRELADISTRKTISPLAREMAAQTDNLSTACNRLIEAAAFSGSLNPQYAWRRVWVAIAHNRLDDARTLAENLGQSLPEKWGSNPDGTAAGEASALYSIISPYARNKTDADGRLRTLNDTLSPSARHFAHGILGLSQAKDLNMFGALKHFQAADHTLFTEEQWQWYARSALRLQQWQTLEHIIMKMPEQLQNKPDWQYWRARALSAQHQHQRAQPLYQQAAASGRNFYAILAQEALGKPLNTTSNSPHFAEYQIARIGKQPKIHQALVLFRQSQLDDNRKMRTAAQKVWRDAVRDADEITLLLSANLASREQFYEMSIYSADKTDHLLDFALRYPTPFLEPVHHYATQNGIDTAWVYGLIRQESRFMIGAQSHVGANGLMQVMPATARYIQKHIALDDGDSGSLQSNIQMGVWYLADTKGKLGDEVLATAGYNAGPARAPRWRANIDLEGAIYAETIPFNETRDYVKKVMANTAYYSAILGENTHTLSQHLGIIGKQS